MFTRHQLGRPTIAVGTIARLGIEPRHDLRARPVYCQRESNDAHLAVVFAALAISYRIETKTGWTVKNFVPTLRRDRTIKITAVSQTLTDEDPLPDDVRKR